MLQEYFIGNCVEYNLKRSEKWYNYAPEGVAENEGVKIL